tara:strand:- start:146 stop:421 length:276 start_codon:yes stop_codon:yes gene_type:complete
MKKLLFSIGAICFFSLNIFAYEIPQKEKEILPNELRCSTSYARDQLGNVIAAASCCKEVTKTLTGKEEVILTNELTVCSEAKLTETLSENP